MSPVSHRPRPKLRHTLVLGAVAALILHFIWPPASLLAQSRAPAGPVQVGIYHPEPRFCSPEYGQRDMRVIRLVFGIDDAPARRLQAPWFLRELSDQPGRNLRMELELEQLFGPPAPSAPSKPAAGSARASSNANPPIPASDGWLRQASRDIPGLEPLAVPGAAALVLHDADSFSLSLFRSRPLLPRLGVAEARAPAADCVQWPKSALYREHGDGYDIVAQQLGDRPSMVLHGYRSLSALWRDFGGGRLNVLLLEGGDETSDLLRGGGRADWRWGRQPGTQQVVLLMSTATYGQLSNSGRDSMSRAVDRGRLASQAGLHGMTAALSFFDNIKDPSLPAATGPLLWDTRAARRQWLGASGRPERLSIAALDNPILVGIASRLAAQWRRTLNLQVALRVLSEDNFAVAAQNREFDLLLDVVDLDNGSLQELWRHSIAQAGGNTQGPPDPRRIGAWELLLQRSLSYLPLLVNVHHVVAQGAGADALLRNFCAGCEPIRR